MRFPLLALLFTATTPIHAGGLYWSDRPAGAGNPHAIRACNFDGSNLRTLSNLGSADPRADPRGVAVDVAGGRVYFLARNSGGSSGELRSVDFSGANPLQHATTLSTPADLRLDAVNRTLYSAIRYRRRANATDLTYVVQVADQLPNWKDNSMAGGPYTEVFSTEPAEDGLEWATVRSLVPLNPGSTEFFRVRVETPAFGAAIAAPVSAKATKRTR